MMKGEEQRMTRGPNPETPTYPVVPKPDQLRELRPLLRTMFEALKEARNVPDSHTFDLRAVDCAAESLKDPQDTAAFALRKLQALYHVCGRGVSTTNSVVVYLAADLNLTLKELAQAVLATDQEDVHDVLVDGRRLINSAARLVSSIRQGEVVELV